MPLWACSDWFSIRSMKSLQSGTITNCNKTISGRKKIKNLAHCRHFQIQAKHEPMLLCCFLSIKKELRRGLQVQLMYVLQVRKHYDTNTEVTVVKKIIIIKKGGQENKSWITQKIWNKSSSVKKICNSNKLFFSFQILWNHCQNHHQLIILDL